MRLTILLLGTLVLLVVFAGCSKQDVETGVPEPEAILGQAYTLFQEGKNEESKKIANDVLDLGREAGDAELIGDALTALCRTALRDNDADAIKRFTEELHQVATDSGDQKWSVFAFHMNAELARITTGCKKLIRCMTKAWI